MVILGHLGWLSSDTVPLTKEIKTKNVFFRNEVQYRDDVLQKGR